MCTFLFPSASQCACLDMHLASCKSGIILIAFRVLLLVLPGFRRTFAAVFRCPRPAQHQQRERDLPSAPPHASPPRNKHAQPSHPLLSATPLPCRPAPVCTPRANTLFFSASLLGVFFGTRQLARQFRLPLMSLRDLMSVVRPSQLVAADSILDAVTYHADPNAWSGDPLMVRWGGGRRRFRLFFLLGFYVYNLFVLMFFTFYSGATRACLFCCGWCACVVGSLFVLLDDRLPCLLK